MSINGFLENKVEETPRRNAAAPFFRDVALMRINWFGPYQKVGLIEFPDEIGERGPVGEQPDTDGQRHSSGDL